jgi:hypothetical protein
MSASLYEECRNKSTHYLIGSRSGRMLEKAKKHVKPTWLYEKNADDLANWAGWGAAHESAVCESDT